jgi:putative transcriptional regulator
MVKNRLKEIIESRGLKQNWLATQVNISNKTLGNIVSNKYNTSLEVALRIAEILNLKIEDIFKLIKEEK